MEHNISPPAPFNVLQLIYTIDLQAFYLLQSMWVDNMVDKSCASYLYQKRGVYYFSKQVPCDVRQRRLPIPIECIRAIQSDCRNMDDDMRWLVALLSDTGMRLGEAVGLSVEDINLNDETPYINTTPHPWRRLKTKGSERCVPLVGEALWAASRAIEGASGSNFLFPRYNRGSTSNANSASAAINKWLKPRVPERCVIHSFRHSMRDRLRVVECPSDIIDAIGGWTTTGVGQRYGLGQPLDVKAKWMHLILGQD